MITLPALFRQLSRVSEPDPAHRCIYAGAGAQRLISAIRGALLVGLFGLLARPAPQLGLHNMLGLRCGPWLLFVLMSAGLGAGEPTVTCDDAEGAAAVTLEGNYAAMLSSWPPSSCWGAFCAVSAVGWVTMQAANA